MDWKDREECPLTFADPWVLGYIKTFKTKKVLKISGFFFITVYKVHGAVVCENFLPIGEFSRTVKNGKNERGSTVVSALEG